MEEKDSEGTALVTAWLLVIPCEAMMTKIVEEAQALLDVGAKMVDAGTVAGLLAEIKILSGNLADSERAREGLRTDLRQAQIQIRDAEALLECRGRDLSDLALRYDDLDRDAGLSAARLRETEEAAKEFRKWLEMVCAPSNEVPLGAIIGGRGALKKYVL
jgi:hypothetical protein